VIVSIGVGFLLYHDAKLGYLPFTGAALGGGVALGYAWRNVLVENVEVVQGVMNAIAIGIIIAAAVLQRVADLDSFWVRVAGIGILSLYMSSYFWLMSDERIIVLHGRAGDNSR
jgi:hypothetical protein